MSNKKNKKVIAVKEIGSNGKIKNLDSPFNVVGNCRLSENRQYLALRLNGENRNDSIYLGILKTDVFAIQESSYSVCNVSIYDNMDYYIVGTARQTKNLTGISVCVTINKVTRFLIISNHDIEKIFNSRNFVGKIIEYKNTQRIYKTKE